MGEARRRDEVIQREHAKQMVFGVSKAPDGTPYLLLGVTASAWDHIKTGNTNHFDLTNVGVPLRLMIYGASDREAAIKVIEDHNSRVGMKTQSDLSRDYGIRVLGIEQALEWALSQLDDVLKRPLFVNDGVHKTMELGFNSQDVDDLRRRYLEAGRGSAGLVT
jgi:arsenate reductase-like glutaredoxin family protein